MAAKNQALVTVLSAALVGAAVGWLPPRTAAAQVHPDAAATGTVTAPVAGILSPAMAGGSEPVVFAGQVSVSGRVIRDTTFGAPPVLELIVDLGGVTARGARSKAAYQVAGQAIVRRPLQPFEQVEVPLSFEPPGNPLQARSAVASFGVHYNAAKGLVATPVTVAAPPPS